VRVKPCFPAHKPTQNTALPAAQPKMAVAIFGFGLSHALESSSGFVRKDDEILKVTAKKDRNREWQPQHATSGFMQAGVYPRWKKNVLLSAGCFVASVGSPRLT